MIQFPYLLHYIWTQCDPFQPNVSQRIVLLWYNFRISYTIYELKVNKDQYSYFQKSGISVYLLIILAYGHLGSGTFWPASLSLFLSGIWLLCRQIHHSTGVWSFHKSPMEFRDFSPEKKENDKYTAYLTGLHNNLNNSNNNNNNNNNKYNNNNNNNDNIIKIK